MVVSARCGHLWAASRPPQPAPSPLTDHRQPGQQALLPPSHRACQVASPPHRLASLRSAARLLAGPPRIISPCPTPSSRIARRRPSESSDELRTTSLRIANVMRSLRRAGRGTRSGRARWPDPARHRGWLGPAPHRRAVGWGRRPAARGRAPPLARGQTSNSLRHCTQTPGCRELGWAPSRAVPRFGPRPVLHTLWPRVSCQTPE